MTSEMQQRMWPIRLTTTLRVKIEQPAMAHKLTDTQQETCKCERIVHCMRVKRHTEIAHTLQEQIIYIFHLHWMY